MSNQLRLSLLIVVVALAGCQPGWVRIDGNSGDADALEAARQACRVDERLAELERARTANSAEAARAGSNDNRMQQLDDFEQQAFVVNQEIDACMQQQGYRRP